MWWYDMIWYDDMMWECDLMMWWWHDIIWWDVLIDWFAPNWGVAWFEWTVWNATPSAYYSVRVKIKKLI